MSQPTGVKSLELTDELDRALEDRVRTGGYGSRAEVVLAALDALALADSASADDVAALERTLARGIEDADAGRLAPLDDGFARVKAAIASRSSQR